MRVELPTGSLFSAPLPPRPQRVEADTPGALTAAAPGEPAHSFRDMVADQVGRVNQIQLQADQAGEQLSTGKAEDFHSAMITLQKASLALDLTIQVRNKAIEAYQEVMRMQI